MIEGNGKDRITLPNFKHFIFSSNERWPIHMDSDDRRFFVLKVGENRKEDHDYFQAITTELDNGGYEALLFDLLNEDITNFNPRSIPSCSDSFDIKLEHVLTVHCVHMNITSKSKIHYVYHSRAVITNAQKIYMDMWTPWTKPLYKQLFK